MTQDFSRGYLPPGLYIEEDESVVVNTSGVPPTLVALVGEGRGYQIFSEQLPFGAEVTLIQNGVDVTTIVVETVQTREVISETEYTVNQTGSGNDTVTSIERDSGASIPADTMVWATYHYTPADYFDPKTATSFEDVKDFYGEPLNLAPGTLSDPDYEYVLSPLSLAAKVAFENGATELVLCATEVATGGSDAALSTDRRTNLKEALDRTATYTAVNVIVPITAGIASADASGALTDLSSHVDAAEVDGSLRFGIIGFDAEVDDNPDELLATAGVKNRRVMLAYTGPGAVRMFSGGINSSFTASHAYLAAAYAGRMSANPVQRALTKLSISSFSGLGGTPLSNALKNQYAKAGIAISEVDRLGRLTVRHGVTTDMTNINTREASVVRARDALVTMVRDGFTDSGLIGEAIDEEMVFSVKSVMQGYLETSVQSEMIVSYDGLAVRQRPTDPSVIEVKFAYRPAYPLNYIAISFSIDTTTGAVEETNLETAA